jgi:single-stranded-DNA-specific exonuclease
VTATALLVRFFAHLGREVPFYIPHRLEEGFGISWRAVKELKRHRPKVLITVDCGTADVQQVRALQQAGIDVIITDHHQPGKRLPPATAIVNPQLGTDEHSRLLCGVGVAFKLVWALSDMLSRRHRSAPEFRDFLVESIALVALGTIADVVPLLGENRIFAAYGLHALAETSFPGLKALMRYAGASAEKLTAYDVAFKLAPRLNAGGRLGEATPCVELLLTTSEQVAEHIARELEKANRKRQQVQDKILKQAEKLVQQQVNLQQQRAIVLAAENWHPGVIGIVAAKLVERYHRPVILVAMGEQEGKGSGRSIPELELHRALEQVSETLASFGGHSRAAGLVVRKDQLQNFRHKFINLTNEILSPSELVPKLHLDCEVVLDMLTPEVVSKMELLRPFGTGNPAPVFACTDAWMAGMPRTMGSQGQHISFYIRQGNTAFRAVGFQMGERFTELTTLKDTPLRVAFFPTLNTYQGKAEVELRLRDFQPR